MAKRVLAITNNFPTPKFPEKGVFVFNILREMARQGATVEVIAPKSILVEAKNILKNSIRTDFGNISVAQPYVLNIPRRRGIPTKWVNRFNDFQFRSAVKRHFSRNGYDFVYAHFYISARPVIELIKSHSLPLIVNLGESDLSGYDYAYGADNWVKDLEKCDLIITVSEKLRRDIIGRSPILSGRTVYLPNGVNTSLFKPMDRLDCRKKLGLPTEEKIVIFCGHLIERKGPLRVLQALEGINVKGIFIGGNGPQKPVGNQVLFCGSVPNSELPYWLNAADVFVLPSLLEGMSNAILEALACGLPLVVSDRDFNRSFLNEKCTVFVDPTDPSDIQKGIVQCLDKKNSSIMSENSILLSKELSIESRIRKLFGLIFDKK